MRTEKEIREVYDRLLEALAEDPKNAAVRVGAELLTWVLGKAESPADDLPEKLPPPMPKTDVEDQRAKVATYLLHAGPTAPRVLSEACKVPSFKLQDQVLAHGWFERDGQRYSLTHEGRSAAAKLSPSVNGNHKDDE